MCPTLHVGGLNTYFPFGAGWLAGCWLAGWAQCGWIHPKINWLKLSGHAICHTICIAKNELPAARS
jgi:hypothetical protein